MSVTSYRSVLAFHPLSVLDEGDQVVVGRADIDSYGVFPRDGADLLETLRVGSTPLDAAAWYRQKYRESVDIAAFVEMLHELRFLREDSDQCTVESIETAQTRAVRWQRLGRALFCPLAWLCYGLIIAGAVASCVLDPRLLPRSSHVFFSDYLLVVQVTVIVGQLALVALHEAFHVLAGRRLGQRTTVRISRRFYFVVFETVLDGLVVVPRRSRYLPIIAGLLSDVLAVAALTLAAYLSRDPGGGISSFGGVCLALAFTTLPRIAWQFYFFLRTDIYYLMTTMLGCVDLEATTRGLLRNRVNKLLGRPGRLVDTNVWHQRDVRVSRWYAYLFVSGYAVAAAMLVIVVLPLAWQFWEIAFSRVFIHDGVSARQFWDSLGLLAFTVVPLAFAAVIAIRERRASRRLAATRRREPSPPLQGS